MIKNALNGRSMLFVSTALAASIATTAMAAETNFSIAPQDLSSALKAFGRQSRETILFRSEQTGSLRSPGAVGRLEPEAALSRILSESGLDFRRVGDGYVVVSDNREPEARLTKVVMQASTPAPTRASTVVEVAPPQEVESVTVTGTSIRGVAPIGSNLVSVGRDAMEKTAPINLTEMTTSVPAITQAGSATQGENVASYYSPSIHSLGGSASNSTLVIVDGLRMPGGGTQFGQTDPNIIPTSAVQRVEVVADGASSIYGSDAVAGVINYITRKKFEGLEFNGRVGVADGWHSKDFNAIWGTAWENGNAYVAAQYSFQDMLRAIDRDFLSRGDYRAQGGRNLQSFNCSPASIITPASGGRVYTSPSATSTVANNEASRVCNTTLTAIQLPNAERINALVRINQDVGDRLTFSATMNYAHLLGERSQTAGSLSNVTVYGPSSGKVGQINPFFRAPAGDPTATSETINWLATLPGKDGAPSYAYGKNTSENDTLFIYGHAEYKLGDSWTARLSDAYGRTRTATVVNGGFCTSCATLALNGTTQINASTTTTSVGGGNIIALNTPLTNANSLDIWGANFGATPAAVIKSIYSASTILEHWNNHNQIKLETQGPLFQLPAGAVRVAAGGEFMWVSQEVKQLSEGGTGSVQGLDKFFTFKLERTVSSGYAEVVVPLVSPSMNVPLVQRLDLDISGRYDHYSDVGGTSNPKIALDWDVNSDLKLRANYATAFVAPPLATIGIPEYGYRRRQQGTALYNGTVNIPVALYPQLAGTPGCENATITCQLNTTVNQGLIRTYGVGPDAKSQTGSSWSIGLNYRPSYVPGLSLSLTSWNNIFKDGVDILSRTQEVNIPSLNRWTFCPTGCTDKQINEFIRTDTGGTLDGTLPSKVYFLLNDDLGNVINLRVRGIDVEASYRLPTENIGNFDFSFSGTWYYEFKQSFPGVEYSVLGTSGSVLTFPSIAGHARLRAGWSMGGFALNGVMNYTPRYRNWSNTSVLPVISNSQGVPVDGGDHVPDNITFDVHADYTLEKTALLASTSLYIDVKNIMNKAPPFYSGNGAYNSFVSSPVGRIISVGFRSKF